MIRNKKAIPMPVLSGIAKVPFVMQQEQTECGAASLAMVLAYYGKWIPLEKLRIACGVSRDGASGKNLMSAAHSYGMTATAYTLSLQEIKENGVFPCIIYVGFAHYVVLCGFKGDVAVVNDPAGGTLRIHPKDFSRLFTGVAIFMYPSDDFEPEGKRPSVWAFTKKRLSGNRPALIIAMLATIATSVAAFINPAFSRVFVDRLLSGANPEWLRPLIGIMAFVAIVQLAALYIKAVYLLSIEGKFAVVADATYMWHVLRMPMSFFSQRMAGDLLTRQSTNAGIANTLIQMFAPLVINTIMMVVYLTVILRMNPLLALIGFTSVIANIHSARLIARRRINLMRIQTRNAGRRAGSTSAAIRMIQVIKASGAERGYFENWAGYQAAENAAQISMKRMDIYLGGLPGIVSSLSNVLILGIGVSLIINGSFTTGSLLAFQGFLQQLNEPTSGLINFTRSFQEMRVNMERVEDVMNYETDKQADAVPSDECEECYEKLTGNVALKNVTFGYSPLDKPVIEDINITLTPGRHVALVGTSGCGKSTIAKLAAGLYRPWSGQIEFDGKTIEEINHIQFSSSVAMVDQDVVLFEDTIAENIKLWDDTIQDYQMIRAANDVEFHNSILQRDGGYNCYLHEDGSNLSGGGRQQLETARALAQEPTFLILDEATSAMDAKTESAVIKAIRARNIACLVVAHRLSTIRNCDEIIVLDSGRIVERGTHEELYAADGLYRQLIYNE